MSSKRSKTVGSMVSVGALFLAATCLVSPHTAGAGEFEVTPTAQPPTSEFLAWAVAETESDTGAGTVSAGSSGDPTTFLEESGYAFVGDEFLRLSFYSYSFAHAARDCATYSIEYSMEITSNGPYAQNRFVVMFDAAGEPLNGDVGSAPAIGETEQIGFEGDVEAADLRGGLVVNHGAVTATRDVGTGDTFGAAFTFGVPVVTIEEDDSACPPPTTTPTTITPTTTTPGSADGLVVSAPRPGAGDTITVSGSGFRARSTVVVSLNRAEVARPEADDSGAFVVSVKVPETAAGSFEVVAEGVDPDGNPRVLRSTIFVQGSDAGPTRSAPQPRRLVATG